MPAGVAAVGLGSCADKELGLELFSAEGILFTGSTDGLTIFKRRVSGEPAEAVCLASPLREGLLDGRKVFSPEDGVFASCCKLLEELGGLVPLTREEVSDFEAALAEELCPPSFADFCVCIKSSRAAMSPFRAFSIRKS